ncbi:MAG: TonB-dependent receptor [Flammeovirgaceae bacterium]
MLLCLPTIGYAQQQLLLQNAKGERIGYAHVRLKGATDKIVEGMSSEKGIFEFNQLAFPIKAQVQHINYKSWEGKITDAAALKVVLEAKAHVLDEVVVTGQYLPQAGELSVQPVRVLTKERITALGTNQLEDVLRQELNIRFTQDMALGVANMTLQGLDGQSVKVLIDGTPIGGRGGTSNAVDLNQINPQLIERIEIIEGPMAVNYGADALAGVINIITKKNTKHTLEAQASWQEGTVGNEYGDEQGIRDVSAGLGGRVGKNFSAKANARMYNFNGWKGNAEGRAKQWLPKDQLFLGGMLRFNKGKFDAYYRIDYLDEELTDLDADFEEEAGRLVAYDDEYLTNRWMHQAQATYTPNQTARLHALASFTDFSRLSRDVLVSPSGDRRLVIGSEAETWFHNWNYRLTASKQALTKWLSGEVGVDINTEKGGGLRIVAGEQNWHDIAFFASSEITPIPSLAIRPGIRWAKNSNYHVPVTPSLRIRHQVGKFTSRFAVAKGFRAPSLRELFFFFQDTNHDIIGNPSLDAETSTNLSAQFELRQLEVAKGDLKLTTDFFFNDVDHKIALASLQGQTSFTYLNIDRFKTLGTRVQGNWSLGNWDAQVGFIYTGFYNRHAEEENNEGVDQDFYYYPELNFSTTYKFDKIGLSVNGFYKYYGRLPAPQIDEDGTPYLAHINPYHWMDLTIQKNLFKKSTTITLGVRNLFDIQEIDNSIRSTGGAHGTAGGNDAVGYGRSYFLRLSYQFNYQKP